MKLDNYYSDLNQNATAYSELTAGIKKARLIGFIPLGKIINPSLDNYPESVPTVDGLVFVFRVREQGVNVNSYETKTKRFNVIPSERCALYEFLQSYGAVNSVVEMMSMDLSEIKGFYFDLTIKNNSYGSLSITDTQPMCNQKEANEDWDDDEDAGTIMTEITKNVQRFWCVKSIMNSIKHGISSPSNRYLQPYVAELKVKNMQLKEVSKAELTKAISEINALPEKKGNGSDIVAVAPARNKERKKRKLKPSAVQESKVYNDEIPF